jgi:hypothetical protein
MRQTNWRWLFATFELPKLKREVQDATLLLTHFAEEETGSIAFKDKVIWIQRSEGLMRTDSASAIGPIAAWSKFWRLPNFRF